MVQKVGIVLHHSVSLGIYGMLSSYFLQSLLFNHWWIFLTLISMKIGKKMFIHHKVLMILFRDLARIIINFGEMHSCSNLYLQERYCCAAKSVDYRSYCSWLLIIVLIITLFIGFTAPEPECMELIAISTNYLRWNGEKCHCL